MAAEPAIKLVEWPEIDQAKEEGKKTDEKAIEIWQKALPILQEAKDLEIKTNDDFAHGFEIINRAKKGIKLVEALYKPVKQGIDASKKVVLDLERTLMRPLKEAVNELTPRLDEFEREQERKRREEEARIREQERKRQEELQLQQAIEAEKEGLKEEAEAILNESVSSPAVVIPKSTPKIQGSSFTVRWSAEVVDLMTLVKAVAAGKVPITALEANTAFLNNQARALKGAFSIPGCRAVSNRSTFSRS